MDLEYPYKEMLEDLSPIHGYDSFCKFLKQRVPLGSDWQAEVKGLFAKRN